MRRSSLTMTLLLLTAACDGGGSDVAIVADGGGSGGDAGSGLDVSAADLPADQLVLSWHVGGGFLSSSIEAWTANRHGHQGVFVYGDGRVIVPKGLYDSPGCRAYTTFTLPAAELQGLVDGLSASLAASDGKDYACPGIADGGTAVLTVDVPGLKLRTTAYPGFGKPGEEDACGVPWTVGPPPADLAALSTRLAALRDRATEPWTPDGLVIAGCAPKDGYLETECGSATEATWPVDVAALATGECQDAPDLATVPVPASDATGTSGVVEGLTHTFGGSVALVGGTCVHLACDVELPHE